MNSNMSSGKKVQTNKLDSSKVFSRLILGEGILSLTKIKTTVQTARYKCI